MTDAADVVVLKPMVLGGIASARDTSSTGTRVGIETVVTTTVDAAVSRATSS